MALASPAGAASKVASTLVFENFNPGTFTFSGSVASASKKCTKGRSVTFIDDGNRLTTTKTGSDGTWAVPISELGKSVVDGFEGKLKRAKVGKGKKRKTCKGDTSAVIVETHSTSFSNFQLDPASQTFSATLTSSFPECAVGRNVELYVDDGTISFVGAEDTGSNGEWSVSASGAMQPGSWEMHLDETADIAAQQSNGDVIFAHCEAPGVSEDIEVVGDTPSISIDYDGQLFAFLGTLSSSVPGCLAGRTVEVYDGDTFVGSTTANSTSGSWSVPGDLISGHSYTAEVNDATVIGNAEPYTVCKDVQSGPLVAP